MSYVLELANTTGLSGGTPCRIVYTNTPTNALAILSQGTGAVWAEFFKYSIYFQDSTLTAGDTITYTVYNVDGTVDSVRTPTIRAITGYTDVFEVTFNTWLGGGTDDSDIYATNTQSSLGPIERLAYGSYTDVFDNPSLMTVIDETFGGGGGGTTPYMDVDVYTAGAVANKVITVKWDNIQDLPPDMYSSSYLVRIGAYYTTAVLDHVQQSMELATVAYREKFYQTTWLECCNAQPDAHHGEIEEQGWFLLTVDLGHHENADWIVDAQYVFKIEQDGTITNQTDPDYSGLPQGHSNTDPRSDDEYGSDGSNYVTQDTGQALSIDNLLTKSYALTDTELIAFGQWLWANDLTPTLYANQVSPIENILSCKRIPFDVATGSPTTIWLGNINSGKAAKVASTNHRQVINSTPITIPSYTHDFLDMQNNISLYLPYCGIQSIPTGVCYKQAKDTNGIPYITGRSLKVEYVFDMIYGSCIACVYIDGVLHGAYNGMCGVDIPLTQSNRASNELSMQKAGGNMATGIISSVLSGALGGIGGGIVGAATGAITGAITSAVGGSLRTKNEAVNMEAHYTTSGGFSSQVASYMPSNVTLIVEHTLYTEPGEYAHENGYPCNLCLNISNLSGYTELDGSIEISNIQCLEEERALLKQALQEGFYL